MSDRCWFFFDSYSFSIRLTQNSPLSFVVVVVVIADVEVDDDDDDDDDDVVVVVEVVDDEVAVVIDEIGGVEMLTVDAVATDPIPAPIDE